jgi:hypothetical protein
MPRRGGGIRLTKAPPYIHGIDHDSFVYTLQLLPSIMTTCTLRSVTIML